MAEVLVPILRVTDGAAAARWYARLGFDVVGEHRFAPGLPLYLFLQRGDLRLHLSEHTGDAPPGGVVYFYVDDLDAIAAEFGADIEEQPWGREIELTDPDANRWRIGTGRASRGEGPRATRRWAGGARRRWTKERSRRRWRSDEEATASKGAEGTRAGGAPTSRAAPTTRGSPRTLPAGGGCGTRTRRRCGRRTRR